MMNMNEAEFVAHALTDYLSAYAEASLILAMKQALRAGEAESAIGLGLGIAIEDHIPLPILFREKVFSIPNLTEDEREWFTEGFRSIRIIEMAA
jgi:hypothetical protein